MSLIANGHDSLKNNTTKENGYKIKRLLCCIMQTLLNIKDKNYLSKDLEGISKPISKKNAKVASNKIDFQLKLPKGDGEEDFILT